MEFEHPFEVGSAYFFRLATYHTIGKVVSQKGRFLFLTDSAWVAQSDRFMDSLQTGILREVEPTKTAYINIEFIVDAYPWQHPLPLEQQ